MSLLARLLLLIALALLPVIGFQVYAEGQARQTRERLVHEDALRLARAAAAEQARLVDGTRLLLIAIAQVPAVTGGDREDCVNYLQAVTQHLPQYANVALAGKEGRVLCAAQPSTITVDVRDRAWFQEATRRQEFVTGEYIVSRGGRRPSIAFGYPVRTPDGEVTAVLGAAIDLTWLSEQIGRFPLPDRASITLLDRNGLVLARRPDLEGLVGRPAPPRLRELLAEQAEGTTVIEGLDGVRRVFGYVPLGAVPEGLMVAVGLDASLAFAAAERATRTAFALIGLGTLFAMLLLGLGARHLVAAPAAALLSVAGSWRSGELSARVAGRGMRGASAEFRSLGRAFDAMAADLQMREAALRESEARLRLAVQSAHLGVWEFDMRRERWRLDRAAVEISGVAAEPDAWVPGSAPAFRAWFTLIHPEDIAARDAAVARLLGGEAEFYDVEYRIRRPDGRLAWIAQRATIVERDAAGAPVRLVGVIQDVTRRRDQQAELEAQVAERTTALRESEARLAQAAKMEALGRLAGGVAHDFNNVLQTVQGGLSLARKRMGRDPAGAARLLDLATDAAARGASVTGRLLAFARRRELEAVAVEPAPLLEGVAEMLRPGFGPGVTLRVAVAEGVPAMFADPGQLESVLVNLANNARDALRGGRGTITLAAARAEAPPGKPAEGYVRLCVADDGEGMPPGILAQVTEPFFSTKPKGKGTGLGLAMARGFAEQSGGALHIESEPGRGTRVSLWLPRATASMPRPAERPAGADAGRPLSLLVVDDEPGVRAVLVMGLAERGHAVVDAASGPEGLARLEAGREVEALVTDLAMPGGMDGLDLIREARRRRPGMPAVLVTGHVGDATEGALGEAAGGGLFAVLSKPVAPEAVEAQVVALLRERASQEWRAF